MEPQEIVEPPTDHDDYGVLGNTPAVLALAVADGRLAYQGEVVRSVVWPIVNFGVTLTTDSRSEVRVSLVDLTMTPKG